jgi:hypothetical protein
MAFVYLCVCGLSASKGVTWAGFTSSYECLSFTICLSGGMFAIVWFISVGCGECSPLGLEVFVEIQELARYWFEFFDLALRSTLDHAAYALGTKGETPFIF